MAPSGVPNGSSPNGQNDVASSMNQTLRLNNDLAMLSQLMDQLKAAKQEEPSAQEEEDVDGEDDFIDMDDENVQELLEALEKANNVAAGIEGRVDALIENLESMLTGLSDGKSEDPDDKVHSAEPTSARNGDPVEEVEQHKGKEAQATEGEGTSNHG